MASVYLSLWLLIHLVHAMSTMECDYTYPGPIQLAAGNYLDDIVVGEIMDISFELQLHEGCPSRYCPILRIFIDDGSGYRLPLINSPFNTGAIRGVFSENTDLNGKFDYTDVNLVSTFTDGEYHKYYFKFSSTQRIFIYDDIVYNNISNGLFDSSIYTNNQTYGLYVVDDYSPLNPIMNGTMINLCISSSAVKKPTTNPTTHPTKYPSIHPTLLPTEYIAETTKNTEIDTSTTHYLVATELSTTHTSGPPTESPLNEIKVDVSTTKSFGATDIMQENETKENENAFWDIMIPITIILCFCIISVCGVYVYKFRKTKNNEENTISVSKQTVPKLDPPNINNLYVYESNIKNDSIQNTNSNPIELDNQLQNNQNNSFIHESDEDSDDSDEEKTIGGGVTAGNIIEPFAFNNAPIDPNLSAEYEQNIKYRLNNNEIIIGGYDYDDNKQYSTQINGKKVKTKTNINNDNDIIKQKEMDKNEVKLWLINKCTFPQYYKLFVSNGYESLYIISNIENKSELNDIGITLKGHQIKIFGEIKKLKQQKFGTKRFKNKNNNNNRGQRRNTKHSLNQIDNCDEGTPSFGPINMKQHHHYSINNINKLDDYDIMIVDGDDDNDNDSPSTDDITDPPTDEGTTDSD